MCAKTASRAVTVKGRVLLFPDQRFLIKLEQSFGVFAPRFFDALAEWPATSRRSRCPPVRSEGCSQTPHELLAFALELLKLRLSHRPPPTFAAMDAMMRS